MERSLSGDDVQAEAEDALEKDISQLSPASNSVAGQIDGGVGSSQTDIADGADESQGRWQTLYAGGLTGTQPDRLVAGGSGATPSFGESGAEMSSFGNDDFGFIVSGGDFQNGNPKTTVGTILIRTRWGSQSSIANTTANKPIGAAHTNEANTAQNNNVAVFRPHIGDNTTGNVRVDNNGTDTDGSISYPDLQEIHEYTVLIDYAGNYLTSGHTGFYIDGDPLAGDDPDADLAATPSFERDKKYGLFITTKGEFDAVRANYLEVSIRS